MAHQLVVVDLACGRKHHALSAIVGLHELAQIGGAEAFHALGCAEDGSADGLLGKSRLLQQLIGDLVGAVAGRRDFLQDHLAFAFQLALGMARVQQNVGQDVEAEPDVGGQHPRE